jgi:F420-dependent oxidoreductase-like protein
MRFAFKTSPQQTTWPELLSVWEAADEIDFLESGWTFDHFYPVSGADPTGPCLEGWMLLAALAQATRRLRLGCLVTAVAYRHPAVLAKMAATVDHISGGRVELGLGAGWNDVECDAYGIQLGTLTERFDRLAEGLEVITGLLGRTSTTFQGRHYQLDDARCEPKPLQQRIPICIGGAGERRTLPLVARWAQHWNVGGLEPDEWRRKRSVLHEHCDAVGRDPLEIMTSVQLDLRPGDDLVAYAERVAAFDAVGVDLCIMYLKAPLFPATLEVAAGVLA